MINTIIIDDELLARNLIKVHISQCQELNLLADFQNPIEAIEFIKVNKIQIVYLDIEMPQMNGLDVIRELPNDCKVILTTAYSDFAIDAFDLQAIDYILKPITFERFEKATLKALEIIKLESNAVDMDATLKNINTDLIVKSSHELIKISTSDIIYIEALHKYVRIVTTEKKITVLYSISAILKELPSHFERCHRSFIVNSEKVVKISGNIIELDTFSIPLSKTYKPTFLSQLGRKIGQ